LCVVAVRANNSPKKVNNFGLRTQRVD